MALQTRLDTQHPSPHTLHSTPHAHRHNLYIFIGQLFIQTHARIRVHLIATPACKRDTRASHISSTRRCQSWPGYSASRCSNRSSRPGVRRLFQICTALRIDAPEPGFATATSFTQELGCPEFRDIFLVSTRVWIQARKERLIEIMAAGGTHSA